MSNERKYAISKYVITGITKSNNGVPYGVLREEGDEKGFVMAAPIADIAKFLEMTKFVDENKQ